MSFRFLAPLFAFLVISMSTISLSQASFSEDGSVVSECRGKTAAEWNTIAEEKYKESEAVDNYRLNPSNSLSEEQQTQIRKQSQKLDDEAHLATANSIGATLNGIGAPTDCQE